MTGDYRRTEIPAVYCTARKTNGDPCRKRPIKGGNVCRVHGGAAKQVKAAAQRRIMAAADPAAAVLVALMYDATAPHAVRLAAAKDLLDRAGLAHRPGIDITVEPKWSEIIEEIVMDVPDGWESPTPAFERDEDFKEPAIESGEIVDAEIIEEPAATPAPPSSTVGSGSLVPPLHIRERLPDAARSNVEWRR